MLFNVIGNTEAGSADASSLELVASEVCAGKSDGDVLCGLQCTPLVPCPDSFPGPVLSCSDVWLLTAHTCMLILETPPLLELPGRLCPLMVAVHSQ